MDTTSDHSRGTLMDNVIKTNNKNTKTQKNKTEDMTRYKDRKMQEDAYKGSAVDESKKLDRFKLPNETELIKINKASEIKSVFRPSRTLSRSPARKSGETTADVDLTGDEDDNVFKDKPENKGKTITAMINKAQKEYEIKKDCSNLGSLNITLLAIDQILGMVKNSNELVNNYLKKATESNSMVTQISTEMGENLTKTRKLIMEAISTYKKEKIQQEEYKKTEENKTTQIIESLSKIENR